MIREIGRDGRRDYFKVVWRWRVRGFQFRGIAGRIEEEGFEDGFFLVQSGIVVFLGDLLFLGDVGKKNRLQLRSNGNFRGGKFYVNM